MSEIEVPLEKLQEDIHHAVHHHDVSGLMNTGAVMSALLAVAAAVCALFAGHFANEAMIEQIQSSDHWSYFQAKGVKAAITEFRNSTENSEKLSAKLEGYKKEQEEIKHEAEAKQAESQAHLLRHEKLAASVTLFQVAIALTAIAVLTRKRRFLMLAGGLGIGGMLWTLFSIF